MRERRNTGALNEHLTIQAPVADPERDALGTITDNAANWEPFALQWGSVDVQGSDEFTRAHITAAEVTHLIKVRYCTSTAAITNKMRIVRQDGSLLNIHAAFDPTNRREWIWIHAASTSL